MDEGPFSCPRYIKTGKSFIFFFCAIRAGPKQKIIIIIRRKVS